jgi:hypothetical protein
MSLRELNAPQPSQHIRSEHGDSSSCGHASERFLSARFAMCELISPDHDGDKAGDFGYGAGKERLQGSEPSIKRRTALGVGCKWN